MHGMGFLKGHAVLDQLLPHLALACPMGHGGDWTDIFLANRIAVLDGTGQKQNLFLGVRFRAEQVHDLHYARPCHTPKTPAVKKLCLINDYTGN